MDSVLITGGTGTLGNGLTERLLQTNVRRICIFSRGEKDRAAMERKFPDDRMRFFTGDVRDFSRVRRAVDGCEVVIHAAALKRIDVCHYNPTEATLTNALGSHNVVEAVRDMGVKKCILISTDKAFEPISCYGNTKALAESIFLAAGGSSGASGPAFARVRYGNVWKSSGSVVPLWKGILASGGTPLLTDPTCTRFFMLLGEAVDFVLGAIEKMRGGELFTPELPAYNLLDLMDAMTHQQVAYKKVGLPAYEKLHESMCAGNCSKDARRMSIEELRSHL